jgi:acyl-CoA reductase-like NAD-dependent aldehyde dehydrogenase
MTTKAPVRPKTKSEVTKVPSVEESSAEERVTAFDSFLEHQRKAVSEAAQALVSLLPVAFKEHGEAAVREVVEGYRTLVNSTIDEIIEAIEKARIETNKAQEKVVGELHSVKDEVNKL